MESNVAVINISDTFNSSDFDTRINHIFHTYQQDPIFVLFTGEKIKGKSWCPDCTASEPIILSALEEFNPNCALVVFSIQVSNF
jgi:thiol-disulfide isomerase/thioredoxin